MASWRNDTPADVNEVCAAIALFLLERAIGIQEKKDRGLLCANRMTMPAGADNEMSDVRGSKACVQRAELIVEWLVQLQDKPVGAPIVERDLAHHGAGAWQVRREALVLVRVANRKLRTDEMTVIVRFNGGGRHTPNETELSHRWRRRP